jgi:predicted nucleotidyltransferase
MNAVGVIVEYNPFHNGHALHLEETKKQSGADVVIAAMSGNFLQRGEPALACKWTRAKMALLAGVDLVFELPYQFATQQAEIFAHGGVSLLSAAGCDSICFGSEEGNIETFWRTYEFLEKNDTLFQQKVKRHMQNGASYPKALAMSFLELAPRNGLIDLSKPNNILGFHYLRAVEKLKQPMKVLTIQRKNADYHDEHFASSTIASATSIRIALFSKRQQMTEIKRYVPQTTFELLCQYKEKLGGFHHWEQYWPFLKYKLLESSPKELREIYEVEEGIEHRLIDASKQADSFLQFMNNLKTKRYTWTRLQRICVHILTNAKKSEMMVADQKVPYLRLLGMTEKGREYLNKNKHHFDLPVISKLSAYKGKEIELDIRSSKIYYFGFSNASIHLDTDYKQTPVYIKKGTDN